MQRSRITFISAAIASIAVAAWVTACGSSQSDDDDDDLIASHPDGSVDGGGAGPSGDGGFLLAYCEHVSSCCGALGMPQAPSACNSSDNGSVMDDVPAETACLTAIATLEAKDPSWCIHQPVADRQICELAVLGADFGEPAHGKLGDTCAGNVILEGPSDQGGGADTKTLCYEIDGLACRVDDAGLNPTCIALGKIGDPCPKDVENCAYGSACNHTTGFCVAVLGEGAACNGDIPCDLDFVCSSSGTCVQKSAKGVACQDGVECISDECFNTCAPGVEVGNTNFCATSN